MGCEDKNGLEKHIHYAEDEEANPLGIPRVTRHVSASSQLSVLSPHGRRGSMEPAYALPIQYRTV